MFRFKLIVGLVIGVPLIPMFIYAAYMDKRLDEFEATLHYQPPVESSEDTQFQFVDQVALSISQGQVVYVPAYSHIYHEDGKPHMLTITMSVRNTSDENAIVVRSIRYFDTEGQQVKSYLRKPVTLGPLGTTEILVERDDATGGSGANFLVDWVAATPVSEPIIEAVMIDTTGKQGISFARSGRVIREVDREPLATSGSPSTEME
ncbi:DUF3124 domain-containing protein [Allorhodopirellula heiligendammensis]|nr:DUF3124 domain-containing protein [Allorhodopirellula heiligendammensis]